MLRRRTRHLAQTILYFEFEIHNVAVVQQYLQRCEEFSLWNIQRCQPVQYQPLWQRQ